jgi:hypothetical protein
MNCLVDFHSVNLGDLILYDEIDRQNMVDYLPIHRRRTGVVIRHIKVVVATQRVYRAQIFGSHDPMTVVVYDDTKFEQAKHHLNSYDSCLIFFSVEKGSNPGSPTISVRGFAFQPMNLTFEAQSSSLGTVIWVYLFGWAKCIHLP